MQNSVQKELKLAADKKQEITMEEVKKLKQAANKQEEKPEDDSFVLMMGNGFGVFQVISSISFSIFLKFSYGYKR